MKRSLFGGAISCQIPENWIDVSNIRQVPDNQECWMNKETDGLFIVEILERQSAVADAVAANYFFDDLAECNGVPGSARQFLIQPELLQISGLPDSAVLCFGTGSQRVAMGRESDITGNPRTQEIRQVRYELCAMRLPSVRTDLLVTLSTPDDPNPQDTGGGSLQPSDVFKRALSSFSILDWSLFGEE
mmetsp:Transcript_32859/g.50860  ORF Transcript_32859/g.50860 Transcript_32859/m.50860 type:complete len:188 (-) Transcript_32859:102-665(-)